MSRRARWPAPVTARAGTGAGATPRPYSRRQVLGLGLRRAPRAALVALILSCALAAGPASADAARPAKVAAKAGGKRLVAKITRTRYGVPHIRGRDWMSVAFGYGYAFAEDNICTMAETYVTVNARRSRWFGPENFWVFAGNGTVNNNLASDFYFQSIKEQGIVEDLIERKPPHGPNRIVRQGVRGYVKGYNAYLRRTGVENLPDERCRGKPWVRPIREIDAYRRFFQLGILASSGAAIEGIANAEPLLDLGLAQRRQERALERLRAGEADEFFPIESGSNAYAIGSDATRGKWNGLVLANPHFPWDGSERFYQVHLTIPGKGDVAGASLYGAPLVLIGHTRNLAWSHTVASAWRFTPYELTINPLNPYQYLRDGKFVDMQAIDVTVPVRTPSGEIEKRSKTLYRTHHGPLFTSLLGLNLFPWTPLKAFALGDVNERNFRYLNHFVRVNMAQSVQELDRINRRIQGIPWVNSIAADSAGRAYYSMDGAIPNVPDSKATGCAGVLGLVLFPLTGIPVLDGSRTACEWDADERAVAPGLMPPERIPRLIRRDFTHNGNDSHWATNPAELLEGFDRIVGDERTERSLRTRIGLIMAQERIAGTDGLPGKGFSLRNLGEVALGNRQYLGELWRDDLVALCGTNQALVSAGACEALAGWDLRNNLNSKGAILFQRFAEHLFSSLPALPSGTSSGYMLGGNVLWTNQFSPGDPVNTPNGMNKLNPLIITSLQNAVADLQAAGIPLDAAPRQWQYDQRAGEKIPIHGGEGGLGLFNAISSVWDPQEGYSEVPHGTSFIASIGFKRRGCPVKALTFVTYSQSENPDSPHSTDYTKAFSRKRWNAVPFCRREVRRQAVTTKRVTGPRR